MSDNNSEGLIIAWGLLIVVICIMGSVTTGTGPVEFFFTSAFYITTIGLFMGLVIGLGLSVYYMFKITKKKDSRPLLQRIREDYSWQAFKDDYQVIVEHLFTFSNNDGETRRITPFRAIVDLFKGDKNDESRPDDG